MTGIDENELEEYPAPRYKKEIRKALKKGYKKHFKRYKQAYLEYLMKQPHTEQLQPQKLEETQHA